MTQKNVSHTGLKKYITSAVYILRKRRQSFFSFVLGEWKENKKRTKRSMKNLCIKDRVSFLNGFKWFCGGSKFVCPVLN